MRRFALVTPAHPGPPVGMWQLDKHASQRPVCSLAWPANAAVGLMATPHQGRAALARSRHGACLPQSQPCLLDQAPDAKAGTRPRRPPGRLPPPPEADFVRAEQADLEVAICHHTQAVAVCSNVRRRRGEVTPAHARTLARLLPACLPSLCAWPRASPPVCVRQPPATPRQGHGLTGAERLGHAGDEADAADKARDLRECGKAGQSAAAALRAAAQLAEAAAGAGSPGIGERMLRLSAGQSLPAAGRLRCGAP